MDRGAVARHRGAAARWLSTRLLERSLPAHANEHWSGPVRRYLQEWWADHQARRLIIDTAEGAVELLDSVMSSDRIEKRWRERLFPNYGSEHGTIRLDETLRSLGEMTGDLPEGSLQRRVACELAQHARTGADWLALLGSHRHAFDILLDRVARQRNAILHGGDTVAEVVASAASFALTLQSSVIYTQLDAATAGEPLLTALERDRIRLERQRARLDAGESPTSAIFAATSP